MDEQHAYRLVEMTNRFYENHASSFSDTRQAPWRGWLAVLDAIHFDEAICGHEKISACKDGEIDTNVYRIADIGCGNLRFERMLAQRMTELVAQACISMTECAMSGTSDADMHRIVAYGIDKNQAFLACEHDFAENNQVGIAIETIGIDIMEHLAKPGALGAALALAPCDLCVCFALMHHVPLASWRAYLLDALVESVRPGGYIAVSFWQFSKDPRILAKAYATTNEAKLHFDLSVDPVCGDYLLGWQDAVGIYRYCHDFSDEEIDDLVACCLERHDDVQSVKSFYADGKTGTLNRYVILKKDAGC